MTTDDDRPTGGADGVVGINGDGIDGDTDTRSTTTTPDHPGPGSATTEPPTTAPAAMTSSPLRRERAAAGPALGGSLAAGVVIAAVLPLVSTVWLLATASPGATALPDITATPVPTASVPTTSATPSADLAGLRTALDALEQEARAAAERSAAVMARLDVAERDARLRLVQKLVARARDARRAAGQSGPALKGPFPVNELGDETARGELGLSPQRWLVTREGVVLVPSGTTSPVRLATTGRDEDPGTFDATIDGRSVTLQRRCVPFEPYCLVDVVDAAPPAVPVLVDTAPLRALVTAATTTPAAMAASARTTGTTGTTATTAATATTSMPRPPTWLALLLSVAGVGLAVVVARRLHALGGALKGIAWRLQAGLGGRSAAAHPHGVAELQLLEGAVDDAHAAVARLASLDDDGAWRRTRLERAAMSLLQARERGGLEPLVDDARDDAATARVIGATNDLLEALDARHRRFAVALTEVDGTVRLITPLAQRLLRLARLDGLPTQAAEELESLGSALGQRARRPQVLTPLLQDLAPLTPTASSIVDVAAAVQPLGEDGVRLAARQLEAASDV